MYDFDELIKRSDLLLVIKNLRSAIKEYESGERYVRMEEAHRKARDADHRTIKRLENELEEARRETIRVRELWYGTCEDIEREKERELARKDSQISEFQKKLEDANKTIKELRGVCIEKDREIRRLEERLEEEKGKSRALTQSLKKDYHNSSKSSAMTPNHAVIHNGREKTGRCPGGQPGHIHHDRKKKTPTKTFKLPTPEQFKDPKRYEPTGVVIRKQLIKVSVISEVIEYEAEEYRNVVTGQRVHAKFPDGVVDDVSYDASVKALAYMVNNELYTSIDKTRMFLKDISHGDIDLSNGFICKLSKEFSDKTLTERQEIFREMAMSPVLHADFTFGRLNGMQTAVIITATEDGALYQGRMKKGDDGVAGSPLEHYEGTLVSDHEAALIKHGNRHQECLAHILRYAKGGIENEPEMTWHSELAEWIGKTIEYWSEVKHQEKKFQKRRSEEYIRELRDILQVAKGEYEKKPPTKYNREGYNTYRRMADDFESYVLFLRDPNVPPTNNLAERCGRKFKRKSHQVMSFRSQDGVDRFCDGLSITESAKARGENIYDAIEERFRG